MEKLVEVANSLSRKLDADLFLFSARVTDETADELINYIRGIENRKPNLALMLTTDGGDPDAGYRIVRCIKQYYGKGRFFLYVFGSCKSTGTLIALGANEIIMGDLGEFGPLDIQLFGGDELTHTSGLSFVQSLITLNEKIYSYFEDNFIKLKGYGITTKTAAEIGSNLAIGLFEPITAQIDPLKLGDVQRAIKIAEAYGERILGPNDSDIRSVRKLIADYPSHSFVIDFPEFSSLFRSKKVRRPTNDELEIEDEFGPAVRRQGKKKMIFFCKVIDDVAEEEQSEPDSTNGKEQEIKQKTESDTNATNQPTGTPSEKQQVVPATTQGNGHPTTGNTA